MQVFAPVFGPDCSWASFDHRLYLHNVLRAYLDRDILPALSHGMGDLLSVAVPMHWLPFVDDLHLCTWRNQLAGQLQPGAAVQTVEVFAVRQGKSPAAYYRLLASDDNMDEEIFSRLLRQNLEAYRQQMIAWNVRLLKGYLV